MKNKKITIIGSGALGTAFSNILFDSGNKNITIYGIDQKELLELKNGKNTKYFSDKLFIHPVNTTNNLKDALDGVDYIIIALPSTIIPTVIEQIKENINSDVLIVSGSKGFYSGTDEPLHKGIDLNTKDHKNIRGVVSILGPSYAEEMINKGLTIVASVSDSQELCEEVQSLFSNPYFKIYTQTDVIGAEAGGIYKNILAIASGMLTEYGFKINTTAAFITRGVHELAIFNKYLGGKPETIMGLTGLGDLILTSMSDLSRNYTFGRSFIRDKEKALLSSVTLEGINALKIVEKIRIKENLDLPIVECLFKIIYS
ncbi:MAG: NAD(P)H-dependent glycerol-3-phosphate dehydrogenase, partial [Mycoplasmataceae bacterium]|nr:NAD(P)H-dependent glycerol-3-phosphate dehydrogenase [Mycoplasmataceae bacterium]